MESKRVPYERDSLIEDLGRQTFEAYAEDGRGILAYHARAVLGKYANK
ncbi:MAG: hypothetical protein J6X49_11540 [Victivallales bacterium]|nr:hypothetical protein [Victivallales bacterium]